jgi:hypothetical protein
MQGNSKEELLTRAKSETMVKSWPAYEKQYNHFQNYCKERNHVASSDSLLAYVQHLELKYSPNTINTWITGIVKVSEQKGCEWTKEALKPVYSRINIGKAGFQTKKAESFSRDDVDCFWEKFSENTPANVF